MLCGSLRCPVVLCGALWCSMLLCAALSCSVVLCGALWCPMLLCAALWYSVVPSCVLWCSVFALMFPVVPKKQLERDVAEHWLLTAGAHTHCRHRSPRYTLQYHDTAAGYSNNLHTVSAR
jgi:hypothetical protein